jgi:hypothetical protein
MKQRTEDAIMEAVESTEDEEAELMDLGPGMKRSSWWTATAGAEGEDPRPVAAMQAHPHPDIPSLRPIDTLD